VPKRLAGASNNVKLSFFSENRQFYADAVPKMGLNRSPPFQKAARAVSHPKHSTFHFKMLAASPSRDNLEMAFPSRDNPEPACKK